MKIVRLDESGIQPFRVLDPFETMSILSMPQAFAFGAYDGASAAGLITGELCGGCLMITWIQVDREYRRQGLSELLLRSVFEMAYKLGIQKIRAAFSAEFEEELQVLKEAHYFRERCFDDGAELYGEWRGELRELLLFPYFKESMDSFPIPAALSGLIGHRQEMALNILSGISAASSRYDVKEHGERLEKDISYVFMDGDEPCGALLLEYVNELIVPVYFYAESGREAKSLVLHALNAAIKAYGRGCWVYLSGMGDEAQKLLKEMLPDKLQKGVIFTAESSDYGKLYY